VESFKSTLDEVREADVLLHVVDISHPQYEEQLNVVNATLAELKVEEKPTITIFNKMDKYEAEAFDQWLEDDVKKEILNDLRQRWQIETKGNCVFVSATEKTNIDALRQTILNAVRDTYRIRYPYKAEFFY
jgi:GTP-binding protein HflX